MKICLFNFLIGLSLLTATGCVSMSSLQTARTLEEGQTQQSFGGGVYNSKSKIGEVETDTNLPYVEYAYRRGFAKDFDAGLKLTFLGAYGIDGKYQIYADQNWAFSAGLGLGYLSYKVSAGGEDQEVKYIDVMLPLYLSYDVSPGFSVYTSPKYISRNVSGSSSGTEGVTGLTLGAKIGEKSGVYLEATMIKGKDTNQITQYNVSYFW